MRSPRQNEDALAERGGGIMIGRRRLRLLSLLLPLLPLLPLALAIPLPAAHAQGGGGAPPPDVHWLMGPATGSLGSRAEVQVPSGYRFAEAADTKKLMESMGNPTSGNELGFLAPDDFSWFLVFEFDDSGFVKDDDKDKLDADAILKSLTEGTEASNVERKKRGWGELHVVGWEVRPKYDETSHNLEWAVRAKSDEGFVVNYNTRILGRKGVMEAALVVEPEKLQATLPAFRTLVGGYQFKGGEKYAEYRTGDKVAAYGLAALVTGGAAAVALKSGLLAKFWKLIVFAFLGVVGFVKKIAARITGKSE